MKTETLLICPKCQTSGFTARGLKAHRCDGKNRNPLPHPAARQVKADASRAVARNARQTSAPGTLAVRGVRTITLDDLEVMPPVTSGNPDADMGAELTAQYHRATGGMIEVLKFGAMMIEFEQSLSSDSTRGVAHPSGSPKTKGTGFKAWLKEHAPDIKEGTAYRLKAVVESIAAEYENVVGKKIAKEYSLPALVTSSTDELPAAVAAKQLELFNFVSGTSQRSWLDRFKPAKRIGGKTYERDGEKGKRTQLSPEEAKEVMQALCTTAAQNLGAIHKEKAFVVLTDAELDGLIDHAETVAAAAKAWRAMTKRDRERAIGELLAPQI